MLSLAEATKIVHDKFPDGIIQKSIDYQGLYVFQIFTDDLDEGDYDPFYSVNQTTGEFRDFSIITDGNTAEIVKLFLEKTNG